MTEELTKLLEDYIPDNRDDIDYQSFKGIVSTAELMVVSQMRGIFLPPHSYTFGEIRKARHILAKGYNLRD